VRRAIFALGAILVLLSATHAGTYDPASPVGRWRTIDDETKAERSIVEISDVGAQLQGRILKVFPQPGDNPDQLCTACEGERKNQPIVGMVFLWGLKRDRDEWTGGGILDPKNGKTYNAKISLIDRGEKLRVRGYIGTPLVGRTQVWLREQ
jgi:uncharacterized protein (DUF2147 family)